MSLYYALSKLVAEGRSAALCTVIKASGSVPRHVGSKMLVYPDGTINGTIGGGEMENRVIAEALQVLAEGRARTLAYELNDPQQGDPGVCGGQLEVFVEPITPEATVVVVGAGHVGQAVAHLAKWLGFRVAVSDDRPEFCNPETVPDADEYYPVPLSRLAKEMQITPQTYLILTTRNVNVDVEGLPELVNTDAAYIGVIGSKRRWQTAYKKLVEQGVDKKILKRVISPMGLELQAETPEEIALSIMAEIVMLRHGADGRRMGA